MYIIFRKAGGMGLLRGEKGGSMWDGIHTRYKQALAKAVPGSLVDRSLADVLGQKPLLILGEQEYYTTVFKTGTTVVLGVRTDVVCGIGAERKPIPHYVPMVGQLRSLRLCLADKAGNRYRAARVNRQEPSILRFEQLPENEELVFVK